MIKFHSTPSSDSPNPTHVIYLRPAIEVLDAFNNPQLFFATQHGQLSVIEALNIHKLFILNLLNIVLPKIKVKYSIKESLAWPPQTIVEFYNLDYLMPEIMKDVNECIIEFTNNLTSKELHFILQHEKDFVSFKEQMLTSTLSKSSGYLEYCQSSARNPMNLQCLFFSRHLSTNNPKSKIGPQLDAFDMRQLSKIKKPKKMLDKIENEADSIGIQKANIARPSYKC